MHAYKQNIYDKNKKNDQNRSKTLLLVKELFWKF